MNTSYQPDPDELEAMHMAQAYEFHSGGETDEPSTEEEDYEL